MPLALTSEPRDPAPRAASSSFVISVSTPLAPASCNWARARGMATCWLPGQGVSNSWPSRRGTSRLQKGWALSMRILVGAERVSNELVGPLFECGTA
ncbi:hypothetical protein D3C75_814710 [compost metagenome]